MKGNTLSFKTRLLYTNSDHIMGNKDKTRDGDAAAENRDSRANRDHSQDRQAARDAALARTITEAVARETQSTAEVFTRQMERAHAQYQDLLKETHAAALPTTLKATSSSDGFKVMDPFNWTLAKLSTRDGYFGHTRLNSHLRQWKETLRRPRSPTCTIGLMVKASQRLKDGKTARFSSVKQNMMN